MVVSAEDLQLRCRAPPDQYRVADLPLAYPESRGLYREPNLRIRKNAEPALPDSALASKGDHTNEAPTKIAPLIDRSGDEPKPNLRRSALPQPRRSRYASMRASSLVRERMFPAQPSPPH